MSRKIIGYKITNIERDKRYGIGANSFEIFKQKAFAKFPDINNPKIYVSKDGTEVQDEEYFLTLEPQTLLVIANDTDDVKTDFQLLYNAIRNVNSDILKSGDFIRNFIINNKDEFDKFLIEYQDKQNSIEDVTNSSTRSEHPDWFEGQLPTLHTKEAVMCRRAQDRIRHYLYKVKDDLTKSRIYRTNQNARQLIDSMLEIFKQFLIGVDYFAVYFDRNFKNKHKSVLTADDDGDTDEADALSPARKRLKQTIKSILEENDLLEKLNVSLCNNLGVFRCQGQWNADKCKYKNHQLNPYANRENWILFQIWNLDHRIEISRTIIPSILNKIEHLVGGGERGDTDDNPSADPKISVRNKCPKHNRPGKNISIVKYFLEIFTIDNLKLVHIVCHDKGIHNIKSTGRIICEKCAEQKFIVNFLEKINA